MIEPKNAQLLNLAAVATSARNTKQLSLSNIRKTLDPQLDSNERVLLAQW